MIKFCTGLFLLLFSSFVAQAQKTSALQSLTVVEGKTIAETAVNIGRQFLGMPYVPHTLDNNPVEKLVVNTREFDCMTYVETVLALSPAWHDQLDKQNLPQLEQTFQKYLTRLRYRNGQMNDYASRLHYFSDWLRDNERKGLVADVTHEFAGSVTVAKPISYMTTATYKYPRLNDSAIYKQIAQTEASLSQQSFAFIPKKNINQAEPQLREGDVIMLTAARPGLDMKHVGIAVRHPNGRMHLMHASSDQGAVVITSEPLSDYVLWHKNMSGIRIARLRSSRILEASVVQGN